MNYGAQNFLQGLNDVANTILRDAAGIAQMRVQASRELAAAEVNMRMTNFQLELASGKINPAAFDDAWTTFDDDLKTYIDEFEFAPARQMIAADIQGMMPKLKLNLGLAMNEANLNLIDAEKSKTVETILNDASYETAEARRDAAMRIVQDGFMRPETKSQLETTITNRYQYDSLDSKVRGMGLAKGVSSLADQESELYKNTPINLRIAYLNDAYKELDANNQLALDEFKLFLSDKGDAFDPTPENTLEEFLKGRDISKSAENQIRANYGNQQIQAMYQTLYRNYLENEENLPGLRRLYNELSREGDMVGYGNLENWGGRQDLREDLMNKTKRRIEELESLDGAIGGLSSDDRAAMTVQYKARMQEFINRAERGEIGYLQAKTGLDLLWSEGTGMGLSVQDEYQQLEKRLSSYTPKAIADAVSSIAKSVNDPKGPFKNMTAAEKERIINDVDSMLRNYGRIHSQPNKMTPEEANKAATELMNIWATTELKFIRENDFTSGLWKTSDAKHTEMGLAIQEGRFDAAIDRSAMGGMAISGSISQAYRQHFEWQRDKAFNEYGITMDTAEQFGDDGKITLKGKDGKTYRFQFDANGYKLLDEQGKEVQTLKAIQDAEIRAAKEREREAAGADPGREIRHGDEDPASARGGAGVTMPRETQPAPSHGVNTTAWPQNAESYPLIPEWGSGASTTTREAAWASLGVEGRKNEYAKLGYRWNGQRFVKVANNAGGVQSQQSQQRQALGGSNR